MKYLGDIALLLCLLLSPLSPPAQGRAQHVESQRMAATGFCGIEGVARLNAPILLVGDSITVSVGPSLPPNIGYEGVTCRQWIDGVIWLGSHRLPSKVVVELGTNGPVSWLMVRRMMHVLGPVRHVWFVTVSAPVWWQNDVNHVLASIQHYWPRKVRLIDWHRAVAEILYLLGPDHVHPSSFGQRFLAQMIQYATRRSHG